MSKIMAEERDNTNQDPLEPEGRPVGGTEYSWCRAVPGGTGITVLGLLLSKPPDLSLLQNALHKLQNTHPILRSKLRFSPSTNTFTYAIPHNPHIQIQPFDLQSTAEILRLLTNTDAPSFPSPSPFHLILEHEMTRNDWSRPEPSQNLESDSVADVFFASVYTLGGGSWAVVVRLHTSACDRAAAAALLRELMGRMMGEEKANGGGAKAELVDDGGVGLGIEEYIPSEKANKPFWARGLDMLGYSLNSFRLANLNFVDVYSPRISRIVRFKLDPDDTNRILSGCKSRGIELCSTLAAAGLIAARSSKGLPDGQWEKYMVATLINCRSMLQPVPSSQHLGFYHSAILNTHDLSGGEELWELAKRTYTAFANAKKNNKHFSDMADVNFLMCKAIENPSLTPSSSLRTSFISVFEEPVIDHFDKKQREIGLEDYIGCASVHGVGPSIAIFDAIRDGGLDCACVYPSPLHSREQMEKLVEEMRRILLDACTST